MLVLLSRHTYICIYIYTDYLVPQFRAALPSGLDWNPFGWSPSNSAPPTFCASNNKTTCCI